MTDVELLAEELYLSVLTRRPSRHEAEQVRDQVTARPHDRAGAAADLIWACSRPRNSGLTIDWARSGAVTASTKDSAMKCDYACHSPEHTLARRRFLGGLGAAGLAAFVRPAAAAQLT